MITRDSEHEVISTLDGEVIDMTLDQNSLAHLMTVLTDLYDYPAMAVLREYATNAWDAHIAAGNAQPIEITLPSKLQPTLVIRDFGLGLDAEDIRDIYSKYGASTKRATDDQTGSLGLGCKSALAYTDQFTVQGTKDGIMTVISVSRDSRGAGSMTLVEQTETDDPNGVTIVVPTKRYDTFREEADDLFRFWPKGSVLVNGEEPDRFEGTKLTDELWITDENVSYVVMGNVPYPVSYEDFGIESNRELALVAFVPMGSVHFSPDREGLNMSDLTTRTLRGVGEQFRTHTLNRVYADLDAAPDAAAALRVKKSWSTRLPKPWHPNPWEYKGVELPAFFSFEDAFSNEWTTFSMYVVPHRSYNKSQASSEKSLAFDTACDATWFVGFNKKKWTPNDRRKLDKWLENNPHAEAPHYVMLAEESFDTPFIAKERIFAWADVKATKLPRQIESEYGRLLGSYDVATEIPRVTRQTQAQDFDHSHSIYYYESVETPGNRNGYGWRSRSELAARYVKAINALDPDCTVALIPPSRVAKFVRAFPKAREVCEVLQERYQKWMDSLSDEVKLAFKVQDQNDLRALQNLDSTKVEDPALAEGIRVATMDLSTHEQMRQIFQKAVAVDFAVEAWHNPLDRYPLAQYSGDTDHLYLYLNTAYNTFYKEQ